MFAFSCLNITSHTCKCTYIYIYTLRSKCQYVFVSAEKPKNHFTVCLSVPNFCQFHFRKKKVKFFGFSFRFCFGFIWKAKKTIGLEKGCTFEPSRATSKVPPIWHVFHFFSFFLFFLIDFFFYSCPHGARLARLSVGSGFLSVKNEEAKQKACRRVLNAVTFHLFARCNWIKRNEEAASSSHFSLRVHHHTQFWCDVSASQKSVVTETLADRPTDGRSVRRRWMQDEKCSVTVEVPLGKEQAFGAHDRLHPTAFVK